MPPLRLNKHLATHMGISRREADNHIAAGKVAIDGKTATLGARFQEDQTITVAGKPLITTEHVYIMLNKPAGYVSSRRQQGSAPTLYDLLPADLKNLKTAGRLDKDSSGLILLTNDGDFAQRMTHPRYDKAKLYIVSLDSPLSPLHQQMISDFGIQLKDGPSKLTLTSTDKTRKNWQVGMHEGRNRQIRRTFGALGYTVTRLHRTSFGPYNLGTLSIGEYKKLKV